MAASRQNHCRTLRSDTDVTTRVRTPRLNNKTQN